MVSMLYFALWCLNVGHDQSRPIADANQAPQRSASRFRLANPNVALTHGVDAETGPQRDAATARPGMLRIAVVPDLSGLLRKSEPGIPPPFHTLHFMKRDQAVG